MPYENRVRTGLHVCEAICVTLCQYGAASLHLEYIWTDYFIGSTLIFG